MGIIDPVPHDTAKYLVRYKIKDLENVPWSMTQFTRREIKRSSIAYVTLKGLIPFTTYMTEVSSVYKDGDNGPYSVPITFTTQEDGEWNLIVDISLICAKVKYLKGKRVCPDLCHRWYIGDGVMQ
jgi:hypothetical protein